MKEEKQLGRPATSNSSSRIYEVYEPNNFKLYRDGNKNKPGKIFVGFVFEVRMEKRPC